MTALTLSQSRVARSGLVFVVNLTLSSCTLLTTVSDLSRVALAASTRAGILPHSLRLRFSENSLGMYSTRRACSANTYDARQRPTRFQCHFSGSMLFGVLSASRTDPAHTHAQLCKITGIADPAPSTGDFVARLFIPIFVQVKVRFGSGQCRCEPSWD